jgi:hypothetical protein
MHLQTEETTTYSTTKRTRKRHTLHITKQDLAILSMLLGCAPADINSSYYYHEHTPRCSFWYQLLAHLSAQGR